MNADVAEQNLRLTAERDRYQAALDTIVNGECHSLDAALDIARAALDGEA